MTSVVSTTGRPAAPRLLAELSTPFEVAGHQVVIGATIGIAIAPGDGSDPDMLLRSADVALTRVYQGRRRMTLTYPMINRARDILWLVTGDEKAAMLKRLRNGDKSIPAGRIRQDDALMIADRAAARQLEPG